MSEPQTLEMFGMPIFVVPQDSFPEGVTAELKIEERNKSLALDKCQTLIPGTTIMVSGVEWMISSPPVMKSELRVRENAKRRKRVFIITVKIERQYAPSP